MQLSKDIFCFSMFANGMSFVDLYHLKIDSIIGARICYRRKKSNSEISIRLTKDISEIIERNKSKKGNYIFPLFRKKDTALKAYNYYKSKIKRYNIDLKQIS